MEGAARLFRQRGVRVVDPSTTADLVLVNTCTVTAVADHKSRAAVRRARRANPAASIVVAGCSVQVDPAAFRTVDPEARLVGNDGKAALLAELAGLIGLDRADHLGGPLPTLAGVDAVGPIATARPIPGATDDRAQVERTRAFVKVQDGCSFFCTYCIIPRARGAERSLAPDAILADIRRAVADGHREIVLTGINIGTYDGGWSERGPRGAHRRSALTLAGLIGRILRETTVERLRLSSIEPQHVDDELLGAWTAGAPRTLPHLHLPLQSGDDGVLHRMGRRYGTAEYAAIVEQARRAIPGVAIHADVIAGFPSEDDAAFARTTAFLRDLQPAGLHVFRYSERPGTAAVRMTGQVADGLRKARSEDLLALAAEARAAFAARRVGGTARVLLEQRSPAGRWVGHADDHVVVAVTPPGRNVDLENTIATVRLEAVDREQADRLVGRILALDPPPHRLTRGLPVVENRAGADDTSGELRGTEDGWPATACSAASRRMTSRPTSSTRTSWCSRSVTSRPRRRRTSSSSRRHTAGRWPSSPMTTRRWPVICWP